MRVEHRRARRRHAQIRAHPREQRAEVVVVAEQVRLQSGGRQRRQVAGWTERPKLPDGVWDRRQSERRRAERAPAERVDRQHTRLDETGNRGRPSVGVLHDPLAEHDVARACDRLRELRVVRSRLVEEEVERDGVCASRHERIEQLRMQRALPAVELRRLADGGRRVARDRYDDDVRRRSHGSANREEETEAEALVQAQHRGNDAQQHAAQCEADGGESGALAVRLEGIG